DVVKTDLPQELEELLEVGVALSRVADDKRAAQRDVGDLGADPLDQPVDVRPVAFAPHRFEHAVRSVLEWEFDVLAELGLGGDRVEDRVAEVRGISVKQAKPLDPFVPDAPRQKLRQLKLPVEIPAVPRGILGNEHHFSYALVSEALGLVDDGFD